MEIYQQRQSTKICLPVSFIAYVCKQTQCIQRSEVSTVFLLYTVSFLYTQASIREGLSHISQIDHSCKVRARYFHLSHLNHKFLLSRGQDPSSWFRKSTQCLEGEVSRCEVRQYLLTYSKRVQTKVKKFKILVFPLHYIWIRLRYKVFQLELKFFSVSRGFCVNTVAPHCINNSVSVLSCTAW